MPSIQHKIVNAEEDDPLRCQASGTGGEGQCRFLSLAGLVRDGKWPVEPGDQTDYASIKHCPKHNGERYIGVQERQRLHDYRLQIWQERIGEFAESDKVKTLRGEIGILRMVIETVLQQCHSPTELMMHSSRLADLVMRVEKLVSSCDKLENKMGMLMDQAGALVLAGHIVQVISDHVKDPETIDQISSQIIDAIVSATKGR